MPARDGETCVICNTRLSVEDKAFLVDGQRIPVMSAMEAMFLEDPMQYVAKYRPEGMMFSVRNEPAMGDAYLFAGIWVVLALIFGGISAHTAVLKGIKPLPWFFSGFFLLLFGYMWLASKPSQAAPGTVPAGLAKVPLTRSAETCGACGASNHPSATECSSCGARLNPTVRSEVASAGGETR